ARKAGRLGRPSALSCWLYGVARRVAGRLRRQSRPESLPPDDAPGSSARSPLDEVTGRERAALLDEALGQMPERLPNPLVLCYLEGRTRDEAAAQLGWSLGTLKRRLEKGRAVLRARLERRGVSLSAALLTATLAEGTACGAVRSELVILTARAAPTYVSGLL